MGERCLKCLIRGQSESGGVRGCVSFISGVAQNLNIAIKNVSQKNFNFVKKKKKSNRHDRTNIPDSKKK